MSNGQNRGLRFDRIGYWSEIKLHILREYAQAYSTIFSAERQSRRFSHVYIDAFSGPGVHLSKTTEQEVLGSPLLALQTHIHVAWPNSPPSSTGRTTCGWG
jgi:three-Cys-motif partner protein